MLEEKEHLIVDDDEDDGDAPKDPRRKTTAMR